MNKYLIAAGLLVLFINQSMGQTLNEDDAVDEDEEFVHSIVKRGYPTKTGNDNGKPGGDVHPGGAVYKKGGSVHPATVGESRDTSYSHHVTQPHYFAFPTRYRGYIANYYYPDFEYANVPSGYATNYYELPVSGKFGGNTGLGALGNNFGGGRAFGGQGLNFAFSGGRGSRGQGGNFAFGGRRGFGGQGSNFGFGGARGFGGKSGNFGTPSKMGHPKW